MAYFKHVPSNCAGNISSHCLWFVVGTQKNDPPTNKNGLLNAAIQFPAWIQEELARGSKSSFWFCEGWFSVQLQRNGLFYIAHKERERERDSDSLLPSCPVSQCSAMCRSRAALLQTYSSNTACQPQWGERYELGVFWARSVSQRVCEGSPRFHARAR